MKKLITILLIVVLALGTAMLVACSNNEGAKSEGTPITKDAFMTELKARESSSFSNTDAHYASATVKYTENSPSSTGTEVSEGTGTITYMPDQGRAYAVINNSQVTVLGESDRVEGILNGQYAPDAVKASAKFYKNGNNLIFLIDATVDGMRYYLKYVFDANGYVASVYELESAEGETYYSETVVKALNK